MVRIRETLLDLDQPELDTLVKSIKTGISAFEVYENVKRHLSVEETRIHFVYFLSGK